MAFAINDGVRIHYEVEGHGPALVLHHGFSGSLRHWYMNGYVEALQDVYRLVLIDHEGVNLNWFDTALRLVALCRTIHLGRFLKWLCTRRLIQIRNLAG